MTKVDNSWLRSLDNFNSEVETLQHKIDRLTSVVNELLNTTELNLDELEPNTIKVINKARKSIEVEND